MRILYTAPFLSYPPIDGSRITPYNHLRCLAGRGHELTMVYGLRRPEDRANAAHLAPFGEVRTVPVRPPSPLGIVSSALFTNESLRIRRHRVAELEAEFERVLKERAFDLVYLDSLFTAYLVPVIRAVRPELPIAIFEHNVESQVFRRLVRRAGGPWRILSPWESPHIEAAERRAVAAVDQVMALSQEDTDALEALVPGSGVVCLGPGTDTFAGESIAPPPDRETALFLGTYQWPPNRDAATWLVRSVWPHVRAAAPRARLVLAGKDPTGDVTGLADPAAGVEAAGFVESARDAYRSAAVSLAPLRIGGGIRLKILDALANERPCVTTTLGVEGLGLRDGEEVSIRDDAKSFAEEVVRLLSGPDAAADLARCGRAAVEGRFSWEAVADRLEGIFTRMVGANRPTKERSSA